MPPEKRWGKVLWFTYFAPLGLLLNLTNDQEEFEKCVCRILKPQGRSNFVTQNCWVLRSVAYMMSDVIWGKRQLTKIFLTMRSLLMGCVAWRVAARLLSCKQEPWGNCPASFVWLFLLPWAFAFLCSASLHPLEGELDPSLGVQKGNVCSNAGCVHPETERIRVLCALGNACPR